MKKKRRRMPALRQLRGRAAVTSASAGPAAAPAVAGAADRWADRPASPDPVAAADALRAAAV